MKKLVLALLALCGLSFSAFAAEAQAPKKNILSSYRIEPKAGHNTALKTAITAHAQKFHKGDQSWRVGEIMSGPDSGMYHIVEGPTSWTALDDRGDLGAEHTKDYETNILPHVEKSSPETYTEYLPELSNVAATQWSNKVAVLHLVVKSGRGDDAYDTGKKWTAIATKVGDNVVTWRSAFSGEDSFSVVFRLKKGLKDFDMESPNYRKGCEELFGPNEYARLQQASADNYSKAWWELIEFLPELGSK